MGQLTLIKLRINGRVEDYITQEQYNSMVRGIDSVRVSAKGIATWEDHEGNSYEAEVTVTESLPKNKLFGLF